MGAKLRVARRRIRSVQSTKKITRAMELIASSRIVKAQQRVEASRPYAQQLTDAMEDVARYAGGSLRHPLLEERPTPARVGVLVVTSDRGLAGAYNANVLKVAERTIREEEAAGRRVHLFVVGRKGVAWYRFRGIPMGGQYTGFTDQPSYADARKIGDDLLQAFLTPESEGGIDEIHVVYTHFVNMAVQQVRVRRILPLEIVDEVVETKSGESLPFPLYEFEPGADTVLDALLPRYIDHAVYTALLMSAASEHAARRRAMKSATDNAEDLIRSLTRQANAARQAEITQEISEIVGGADALASA